MTGQGFTVKAGWARAVSDDAVRHVWPGSGRGRPAMNVTS